MGKKLDKKAEPAAGKTSKGMKVDKAVKKFRKLEGKLWTREYLLKIAEFDGATIAPANGAAARADAMGTLAGEHHKLLTSEKSVELVRSLARETVAGGKIDDPQLLDEIRVLGRDQREASAIPTEEAEAWTRLTCEADAVWRKAKAANDWASFETYVDRIVAQLKHQAELMDPKRDPYDVWLDQYERGLSAKSFDAFLRRGQGHGRAARARHRRARPAAGCRLFARPRARGCPASAMELRPYEACRPGPGRHHACLYRASV